MVTVLLFLLVLTIVVLVHEAGHFFVAKWSGMKVYEFGWGFPPRAFGFYKDPKTKKIVWVRGSSKENLKEVAGGAETVEEFPATLYSVNWLPLGGFVKIKGENDPNPGPDSFAAKSRIKRLATLLAGVVMNVLLAAVLFSFGYMYGLPGQADPNDKYAIQVSEHFVFVQSVQGGSPAEKAGIELGDIIKSVNGDIVTSAARITEYTRTHGNDTLVLLIDRNGKELTVNAKPEALESDHVPRLGVGLGEAGLVRYPWYWAIIKGFQAAWFGLLNIFVSLYVLLKNLLSGNGVSAALSGPVGIAVIVGQSARLGLNYLISVTAAISLSLAAMNVLPIPALDGGRVLFVLIEGIFGKKVPAKVEQIAHAVGFISLLLLIVVITWRDIAKLL